jgi:NADH-quinone oxidoreductase subunit N
LGLLFSSLLPRGLAFGVWALAIAAIARIQGGEGNLKNSLSFSALRGVGRKSPLAATALLLAIFSLAGFPLLAGFPVRLALWQALAGRYFVASLVALSGSAGLMIGGLRTLAVLITGSEDNTWAFAETWGERFMIAIGGLSIILVGIFPQWFLPALASMTAVFLSAHP